MIIFNNTACAPERVVNHRNMHSTLWETLIYVTVSYYIVITNSSRPGN